MKLEINKTVITAPTYLLISDYIIIITIGRKIYTNIKILSLTLGIEPHPLGLNFILKI